MEPDRTCARILFSRIPVPGKVKTRLAPVLSAEQRAELQEALVVDAASKLLEPGRTMVLCYSDEEGSASSGGRYFGELFDKLQSAGLDASRIVAYPQRGVDLGERMSNALADAFAKGADSCLLMGSDLPFMTSSDIARAEALLVDADVVFGPSPDGGFWLVGMSEPFPELFEGQRYSKDDVLERALALCAGHGKTTALAPFSSDIDTPGDYLLLAERVKAGDPLVGERTAQVVKGLMAEERRGREVAESR